VVNIGTAVGRVLGGEPTGALAGGRARLTWAIVGLVGWGGLLALGVALLSRRPPQAGFDLQLVLDAAHRAAAGQPLYQGLVGPGTSRIQAVDLFYAYPPVVAQAFALVAWLPSGIVLGALATLAVAGVLAVEAAGGYALLALALVLPAAAIGGGFVAIAAGKALAVRSTRTRTGPEGLIARVGVMRGDDVVVQGERWRARRSLIDDEPAGDGEPVVVTAEVILIATGSRPFHPSDIPFDHPDVLDSDAAAALDHRVADVLVLGGGAVACEFASIFAALDTVVTIVEGRDRLLGAFDEEIAALLTVALTDIGVRIVLGGGRPTITVDADGVRAELASGEVLRPGKVVVAAGRAGNTDELGLDTAGVATDERGLVVVDENYATTAAGIYAAGDVVGPPALASVSMEQGRLAVCHAFGIPVRQRLDAATPYGVYTIPEAAMVGLTETNARAVGHDVAVGRARLARNARTAITGGSPGLVKLVVDRSDGRLLGAHVLGDNATELIHQAQAVIHFGGTVDYFIEATYNVPTASEAFKYAAYDALSDISHETTLTSNV